MIRRRSPGFLVPDPEVRFAFDRAFYLQSGWMFVVGVVLLSIPSSHFATNSWAFLNQIPGADDTVGAAYLTLGVAMTAALWFGHQRWMAVALGVAGSIVWTFGVFLLLPVLSGATGGIGFALAFYPGAHMLSTSVTLWHRHELRP